MRTLNRHLYLLTAFVVSLSACVHVAANRVRSPDDVDVLRMHEFLVGLLLVAWLIKDPKLSKSEHPSIDHGFLHLMFFPFYSAYQQFAIRRWKGIAIVLGLFLLLLAPFLTMLAQ